MIKRILYILIWIIFFLPIIASFIIIIPVGIIGSLFVFIFNGKDFIEKVIDWHIEKVVMFPDYVSHKLINYPPSL